jgi:hypothetical protein
MLPIFHITSMFQLLRTVDLDAPQNLDQSIGQEDYTALTEEYLYHLVLAFVTLVESVQSDMIPEFHPYVSHVLKNDTTPAFFA